MSSKSSSNKNIKDLREQINHLSLNLNPNEINSNNSNNQTPLKNVYSNISSPHSSNSVQKLSELEEKLKSINLGPNIDNYYKSIKTENPGIIPQMRRMELLQRKMNLLQNTNEQNSKALQEILEIEMKERLRYPKYTIIQNTPLTPHEEIMNQIIQKKLGPGAGYSMDYPTVVFKNKNEIDEMRNIQTSNNNNINNNISNNNNFGSNRVVFQSNDNKPVTVKMIKEIQKEILNLRKAVSELKIQLKEMKNNFKSDLENDINSNKLLVEIIRKVIEEGGDNKLKSSVEKNFDRKKINIEEIKTDLEIFKTEELNDIIKEEINKYDKKMNKILDKMKNDLEKIINDKNILNNNDNINTNLKINLLGENNKISELNENSTIKKEKSQSKKSSKVSSKKSNSLNLKTDGKNSDDSNMKEEEEKEEEDDNSDSDESKTYTSNKKSKKNSSSHKSKTKSKKTSSKKSSSKMPSSGS